MTVRPLVLYPDPRLNQVSAPVGEIDDAVRRLAADLIDTMRAEDGAGIAAIQVGEPLRMLVVEASWAGTPEPLVLINPELVAASAETTLAGEGCLSVPGLYEELERPSEVTVRYLTLEGRAAEIRGEGQLAVCLQHEMDHLEGVIYLQHLSRLRRERAQNRYRKLRSGAAPASGAPVRRVG